VLRLLLPPNLATAAPRDAIAVKVELDLAAAPSAELLPVLAALQRLCGSACPSPFLQLTRAQLRELVTAAGTQSVFFWVNDQKAPILWVGPILRGVSEHLVEAQKPGRHRSFRSENRKSKFEIRKFIDPAHRRRLRTFSGHHPALA
jgi:hypothetical protein